MELTNKDQSEARDQMFVELAKVKSQPAPIKIETSAEFLAPQSTITEDESEGQLTVDVFRDKDDLVVQSTVSGVNLEELEIMMTTETITIKGVREKTKEIEEKDYFFQECFWGTFSRSIVLPMEVDPDKSSAELKNGLLTIRMPILNREKTKKLKVKGG